MSERISLNRLYDKLHALGVAPKERDSFGKFGNRFWVMTSDTDYADRLAGAVRRAGGRAFPTVTAHQDGTPFAHIICYIDDMFDDPSTRQPPLMQIDGWT